MLAKALSRLLGTRAVFCFNFVQLLFKLCQLGLVVEQALHVKLREKANREDFGVLTHET